LVIQPENLLATLNLLTYAFNFFCKYLAVYKLTEKGTISISKNYTKNFLSFCIEFEMYKKAIFIQTKKLEETLLNSFCNRNMIIRDRLGKLIGDFYERGRFDTAFLKT
jgi:hypothetical protein